MEDLTGLQLGPYQIVAPLGEGGMAAVYQAYQPGMERYVALKILPRHFAGDPQFAGRFEQEAKVIARLQHPHILPVFDYGQAEGYTYIAMPFIKSGTLADLLKGRPLPLQQIRNIITQIGDALDYAHSFGLVHRDIKPSNVLVDERGNCLLTDFGIAKMVEGTSAFTRTGGVIGTPAYMSPEQGTGQKIDQRSDIYSLGIMLYEMATGRVPYQAETPVAVVFKHARDPLPPPRSLNPALPVSVERVILKALAKGPADRYATGGQMVQAIRAAIPDSTVAGATRLETGATQLEQGATRLESPRADYAATAFDSSGRGGATVARPAYAPPAVLPRAAPAARRGVPAWVWAVGCLVLAGIALVALIGGAAAFALGPFAAPTPSASATATAAALVSPAATTAVAATATALPASDTPVPPAVATTPSSSDTPTPVPPTFTPSPTLAPPTFTPTFTASPPPDTPTPVPAFVEQASYAENCANRPAGSVCLSFSDGYVWLIYDSVAGSGANYSYQGQTVEVKLGFQADYHHVLGTNLVKQVPK